MHRVPQPHGDADPIGIRGLVHLREQVGFYQQVHEVRVIRNGEVDALRLRACKRPLYDVAQHCRALPVDGVGQRLACGMRLCIEPSVSTDAVAMPARLGLRGWVHGGPWPW